MQRFAKAATWCRDPQLAHEGLCAPLIGNPALCGGIVHSSEALAMRKGNDLARGSIDHGAASPMFQLHGPPLPAGAAVTGAPQAKRFSSLDAHSTGQLPPPQHTVLFGQPRFDTTVFSRDRTPPPLMLPCQQFDERSEQVFLSPAGWASGNDACVAPNRSSPANQMACGQPPWRGSDERAFLATSGQNFHSSGSGSTLGGGVDRMVKVADLSPFLTHWKLVARVTKKNSVRQFRYKNRDGEGQMFSIDLVDRDGGETRASFFGTAVDRFHGLLQERAMFAFSGGKIKKGDRRFCCYDHEITFDEQAHISAADEDAACPQVVFTFTPLAELVHVPLNSMVDIAAIVAVVERPVEVHLRAGGTKNRMNLTLLDDSGASCRLTLWGEWCDKPWHVGGVVLIKSVKLGDYCGYSLSVNFSSVVLLNADAQACHQRANFLLQWYSDRGLGALASARVLSSGAQGGSYETLAEVQAEAATLDPARMDCSRGAHAVGRTGTAQRYHTARSVTVSFLPSERPPFYLSCPVELPDDKSGEGKMRSCNKKVEQSGIHWVCSAGHCCDHPRPRWVLNLSISDHTASQVVSTFDEIGQQILCCDAAEAARLWAARECDHIAALKLDEMFRAVQFKRYRMRLRSKKEMWNDEERLKVYVVECSLLTDCHVAEGRVKLQDGVASVGDASHLRSSATAIVTPVGA